MIRSVLCGGFALLAGVGVVLLIAQSRQEAGVEAAMSAVLAVTVGWTYIGGGLVAWRQRSSRIGTTLVFIGFAWFVTYLAYSNDSFWFTLGTAAEDLYLVGVIYLILMFPHGMLGGAVDRGLVAAAAVLGTVVELGWLVLADSTLVCTDCPENAFQIARNDAWALGILQLQRGVALVVSILTVAVFVHRIRRAAPPLRRALTPVLWTGGALCVALAVTIVNDIAGEPLGQAPNFARGLVFAAVPVAILSSLLQQQLARGAVAELVVELDGTPGALDLREALSRALRDPDLTLGYWLPANNAYVDSAGQPLDVEASGRATTVVQRNSQPVAVLVHNDALQADRELVDSVCAAAGMALENERLRADLEARLAELRASRERLVRATEAERDRIQRDLHDGAQQRLVSIAMSIASAEANLQRDRAAAESALNQAREDLTQAMEELRTLSQGIRPAILIERGLGAALTELTRRSTLPATIDLHLDDRLSDEIAAAAYFVASEALTNAAKHAHATTVTLAAQTQNGVFRLQIADDGIGGAPPHDGSAPLSVGGTGPSGRPASATGLRGLADRVEAFGGTFTIDSPAGAGTVLQVRLPCG